MTPAERTDRMIGRIAREHGVTVAQIKGETRCRPVVSARFEVYDLLHRQGWGLAAIGRFLGGRDHSTIRDGLRISTRSQRHKVVHKRSPVDIDISCGQPFDRAQILPTKTGRSQGATA